MSETKRPLPLNFSYVGFLKLSDFHTVRTVKMGSILPYQSKPESDDETSMKELVNQSYLLVCDSEEQFGPNKVGTISVL